MPLQQATIDSLRDAASRLAHKYVHLARNDTSDRAVSSVATMQVLFTSRSVDLNRFIDEVMAISKGEHPVVCLVALETVLSLVARQPSNMSTEQWNGVLEACSAYANGLVNALALEWR